MGWNSGGSGPDQSTGVASSNVYWGGAHLQMWGVRIPTLSSHHENSPSTVAYTGVQFTAAGSWLADGGSDETSDEAWRDGTSDAWSVGHKKPDCLMTSRISLRPRNSINASATGISVTETATATYLVSSWYGAGSGPASVTPAV